MSSSTPGLVSPHGDPSVRLGPRLILEPIGVGEGRG